MTISIASKRMEILSMHPGHDLDLKVATNIMGLKAELFGMDIGDRRFSFLRWPKPYSTDMGAAYAVVKKANGWLFSKRKAFLDEIQGMTRDGTNIVAWPDVFWTVTPDRICKAALLVVASDAKD